MSSPYITFFLNSKRTVVQFDCIEISHPDFSQVFRMVRNKTDGLDATIEDKNYIGNNLFDINAAGHVDDKFVNDITGVLSTNTNHTATDFILVEPNTNYYITRYNRIGWYDENKVFISSVVAGGDASDVLKSPIDALYIRVSCYAPTRTSATWLGLMIAKSDIIVPYQQFGPITEIGTVETFDYVPMQIQESTVKDDLDFGISLTFGDLGELLPTELDAVQSNSNFATKPTFIFRSYRSDDLTQPMFGPVTLEVQQLTFDRYGASFEAVAPSINLSQTGESYRKARFVGLIGL